MGTFILRPRPATESVRRPAGWEGLSNDVLMQDAHWFTRIRWVVALVFAGFGAMATLFPGTLSVAGVRPPALWPWALAGAVALVNLAIIEWLRRIVSHTTRSRIKACIWIQITADLLVLTALVYFAGTVDTVIPFAYLFHIVLACIFFGRRESVLVVLLSGLLYLSVVAMEGAGVLPVRGVLESASLSPPDLVSFTTTAAPTVFIWFVVWYLASTISESVRRRDRELDAANRRLVKADADKNLQVLRVTHDLKAPFVGIETNIQTLRLSVWNEMPPEAREIINRIEGKSETLRTRISDVLTLGNLRSERGDPPKLEQMRVRETIDDVIRELLDLAGRRNISVVASGDGLVRSDPKQLKILFSNLIANAITYSREGGQVNVDIDPEKPVRVKVADHGIGISEKALPHIFEEYYRSKEAARCNSQSTGLGLAIAGQVAQNLGLTVNVNSEQGEGAVFEVVFPA